MRETSPGMNALMAFPASYQEKEVVPICDILR